MPTYTYHLLTLVLLLPIAAAADVLLERVTQPGYVMEAYAASTSCTIDETGRLRQRVQLGELSSARVQQTKLTAAAVKTLIAKAARGDIKVRSMPVDGPSTFYRAYKQRADGKYRSVVLREENGGSGVMKVNQASDAIKLKNFIDLVCDGAIQYGSS